jgi:glycosyltransferase involved in cell wall biosynthesis
VARSVTRPPRLVVHDVEQHGVAAYARSLAEAVASQLGAETAVPLAAVAQLPAGTPLHLQFTDRLWGATPEDAAQAVRRLAAQHPLTVTMHDVPQESDGARNLPRRRESYRAVAAASVGVACNSAHEAALLEEHGVATSAAVIPLPIDPIEGLPSWRADGVLDGSVGVLGFFYPGKGHDEALAAAIAASVRQFSVLGRASEGHAADLEAFVRAAAAHSVEVEVTGYLDDDELVRRCRRVSVPVIAHRHVSASGSLGSWIAAGRRPVATANRYIAEMAALRPGTLTSVAPERLADAVAAAAADPASTWLTPGPVPHGRRELAAAYLSWWEALPW